MRAKIITLSASWGSGLATLHVENEDGTHQALHADNGPLMRALDSAFPGFIQPGHTVDVDVIRGKVIEYVMDDMGLCMAGFAVVEGE